jgi:hypothetical protein
MARLIEIDPPITDVDQHALVCPLRVAQQCFPNGQHGLTTYFARISMPRTLLGTSPAGTITLPSAGTMAPALSAQALDVRLRGKRSASYLDAIKRLDAGGHVCNRDEAAALLDAIRAELPEIAIEQLAFGIVARCRLGSPYEVHTLERDGQIIRHYKVSEALPGLLERARSLALHPGYAFIEVYANKLIAVADSGDTAVIQG